MPNCTIIPSWFGANIRVRTKRATTIATARSGDIRDLAFLRLGILRFGVSAVFLFRVGLL